MNLGINKTKESLNNVECRIVFMRSCLSSQQTDYQDQLHGPPITSTIAWPSLSPGEKSYKHPGYL